MKLEICSFSGYKIYPGHGKTYVRTDNRAFRFLNSKSASLFLQRKNPRKVHWTILFRRLHKKGITEETAKKRTRRNVRVQRAVVGATLEQIRAKREQKPELRQEVRAKAIDLAKKKKREEADKKKTEKAKVTTAARGQPKPKVSKQQQKGARPMMQAGKR